MTVLRFVLKTLSFMKSKILFLFILLKVKIRICLFVLKTLEGNYIYVLKATLPGSGKGVKRPATCVNIK
jgi:hypothetical protein